MTEADVQMLRQAAGVALEDTDDGVMVHWENLEIGVAGVLRLLATLQQGAKGCRELGLFIDVGDERGRSLFNFFRQSDGSWRVPSSRAQTD